MSPIILALITADRPELAVRCLDSYLRDRSLPAEMLVFDDSRKPAPELKAPARRVTRADRQRYITHLVHAGIPPSIASFCLLGPEGDYFTAGANRNAALLDSCGEKLLTVDDDTLGVTAVHPHAEVAREIVQGNGDPTDIHFFRTRAEAMAAGHWTHIDIFEEDARLLGTPVSETGRIALVSHGVVGDSGFFSPAHLLWMASPATEARLRNSDATLETAMTSREVIRLSPQPTLTRRTVCMATAIGLDNRELLPPFLPAGRNEDGFFGNLVSRCLPDAYTLHAPFGIAHVPEGERRYQRLVSDPQTLRCSELIILLLSSCPLKLGVQSAAALRTLGDHLKWLSRSPEQFAANAREIVRAARIQLLQRIEGHWESLEGNSALWLSLAGQFRRQLKALIESPDCWKPSDFATADETHEFVQLTGQLLCTWPDIVEAATTLRKKETRISRDVPGTTGSFRRFPAPEESPPSTPGH